MTMQRMREHRKKVKRLMTSRETFLTWSGCASLLLRSASILQALKQQS
jgi:hypothetical protein